MRSTLTLLRASGSVQSRPSISPRFISAASARRAAVSSRNCTKAPKGPGIASAAFQIARNSSSVSMRARARSLPFVRAMPRTIGERKSSERLACQFMMRRTVANVRSAITRPLSSSILSSKLCMIDENAIRQQWARRSTSEDRDCLRRARCVGWGGLAGRVEDHR
jgi:hypothetical protein